MRTLFPVALYLGNICWEWGLGRTWTRLWAGLKGWRQILIFRIWPPNKNTYSAREGRPRQKKIHTNLSQPASRPRGQICIFFSRGRPEGTNMYFFFRGAGLREPNMYFFSRGRPDEAKYVFFFRAGPVPCMYFSREVPEGLILLHFVRVLESPYEPTEGPCMYFFFAGPAGLRGQICIFSRGRPKGPNMYFFRGAGPTGPNMYFFSRGPPEGSKYVFFRGAGLRGPNIYFFSRGRPERAKYVIFLAPNKK